MLDQNLPRYDWSRTYEWNYHHAPDPVDLSVPQVPGEWDFCGLPVPSPLGVPAGPLLNGRWCLYYASLGFDVLTYKTVRSSARDCYPLPNLQPVAIARLAGGESAVSTAPQMSGSWAVSFGMPSRTPDEWRGDVERTRDRLPKEKVLVVSVVGTAQTGWTIDELAADYAQCARWAVLSGADVVEANFSCPNVDTVDGQLYQQPSQAGLVAERLRTAIGQVPLVLKIGHLPTAAKAESLIEQVAPFANALSMTNSIATAVEDASGSLLFEGQCRGICGAAITQASIEQVRRFARQDLARQDRQQSLKWIGVGGIFSLKDVRDYLRAGAHAVQLATSAMLTPDIGLQLRRQWVAELAS